MKRQDQEVGGFQKQSRGQNKRYRDQQELNQYKGRNSGRSKSQPR